MNNSQPRRFSVAARMRYGLAEHGPAPLLAAAALFAQSAIGIAVSYSKASFAPHFAGACVATVLVLWAGIQAFLRNMQTAAVRRAALWLISLTFSQLLLGTGAFMNLLAAGALQWLTVAHAVMAFVTFGASITLAALVYRQIRPEDAELAHGGVVIA
jgi:heme A synthase